MLGFHGIRVVRSPPAHTGKAAVGSMMGKDRSGGRLKFRPLPHVSGDGCLIAWEAGQSSALAEVGYRRAGYLAVDDPLAEVDAMRRSFGALGIGIPGAEVPGDQLAWERLRNVDVEGPPGPA